MATITENKKVLSKEFVTSYVYSKIKHKFTEIPYNEISKANSEVRIQLDFIKQIDGITCSVFINLDFDGDIYLDIICYCKKQAFCIFSNYMDDEWQLFSDNQERHHMSCDEYEDCQECSKTYIIDYDKFSKNIKKIDWTTIINDIINMKYNHVLEEFIDYEISDQDLITLDYQFDECCCCYQNTTHKDVNGHYLCSICFHKLQGKKECPLCRIKLDKDSYSLIKSRTHHHTF